MSWRAAILLGGALALVPAVTLVPAVARAATWGSFDGSRINYQEGVLVSGSVHTTLRALIGAQDELAAPIGALSPRTLAGIDVFYTSLLRQTDDLSVSEQVALFDWVYQGGTLVVTADTFPLDFYTSFTAVYGVDLYADVGDNGVAVSVADHPLVEGVDTVLYVSNATFAFDDNATELLRTPDAFVLAAVIEPAPDTCSVGRVLVIGDHTAFTDAYIDAQDNLAFATNVVNWARNAPEPLGCCGNGQTDPTEDCDDGNRISADGCENDCTTTPEPATGSSSDSGSSSSGGDGETGSSTGGPSSTTTSSGDSGTSGTTTTATSTSSGTSTAAGSATDDTDEDPPVPTSPGCGCSRRGRGPAPWLWALGAWLAIRRPRRRRS